jgi:hypothetical protein
VFDRLYDIFGSSLNRVGSGGLESVG